MKTMIYHKKLLPYREEGFPRKKCSMFPRILVRLIENFLSYSFDLVQCFRLCFYCIQEELNSNLSVIFTGPCKDVCSLFAGAKTHFFCVSIGCLLLRQNDIPNLKFQRNLHVTLQRILNNVLLRALIRKYSHFHHIVDSTLRCSFVFFI